MLYIICEHVASFIMIHFNPEAPEGFFLILLQCNLLAAFCEIDPDVVEITMKYYRGHAFQWFFVEKSSLKRSRKSRSIFC